VTEFAPGDSIGGYRLEALLGEGAVGIVFRAARISDGTILAVKILRESLTRDDNHRARLLRELRVARQVEHRHLVPIVDAGEEAGRAYLAAHFVSGRSLAATIAAEGLVPIERFVKLASEVGSGLDALHTAGIVHRDVKPSNVMIEPATGALLADFGLAKAQEYTVLTEPGRVVGSLPYLAPELLHGEEARPASDIYSLGCLLFQALTGAPPFAGRSFIELGVAHLERDPPEPSSLRPDVSAELSWALLRALAKDPAARPPTAATYVNLLRVAVR